MKSRWLLRGMVLLAVTANAAAQTPDALERQTANTVNAPAEGAGPRATVADFRWLVGRWVGTGLGGVSEEVWSEPAGGAMMGMFRLVTKDAVTFYEFMNLVESNGSVVLRLKHFTPDMVAWEDKDRFVTFRLAKVAPNEAWFGGLTFRRIGDDRLQIFLALRDSSGNVREEEFRLERR